MEQSNWSDPIICDKKDKRLLIPRPYPRVGWSFNFGQPLIWVFLLTLIVVIVACAILLKWNTVSLFGDKIRFYYTFSKNVPNLELLFLVSIFIFIQIWCFRRRKVRRLQLNRPKSLRIQIFYIQ